MQDMIDQLTQFASSCIIMGCYARLIICVEAHVPAEDVPSTPLCLKGTAGLRRLTLTEQSTLIGRVRNMLRRTGFSVDTSATRVIDGAEEALYDWLAVQVAFAEHPSASLGALDLGGASKQIAYVMKGDSSAPDDNTCSAEWSVRLPSGERPAVRLLAKSVAGLGLIAAMDAVLHDASATAATAEVTEDSAIWRMSHPCLPLGIYPVGSIHHFENVISGSGNFSECAAMVNRLLMPVLHAQIDVQCMQQHRPTVVIGMDGFAKIVHMLGLSSGDHSALTPRHIADAGRIVCSRDWEELLSDFPGFSAYRAQRACFGAAYIYSLLTGAYGLEDDTEGEFWPLEHVGDVEISWALGAVAASTLPEGAIRDLR